MILMKYQLPPKYLMDIILKFFHFPQINVILKEILLSDFNSHCYHVGQYWKFNSSDLLLLLYRD